MAKYDVRDDKVLFIDVEMTCWDGPPPLGESPEIIEIGVAEVDVASLCATRSQSFLVRPVRSTISAYCEQLTNITTFDLKSRGRHLRELVGTLRKQFGTASKAWMAWGADRRAIDNDCTAVGVESPFSNSFHDVGFQFSTMLGAGRAIGLSEAMEIVGVERRGRVHSGMHDAEALADLWIAIATRTRQTLGTALVATRSR